MASGKKKKKMFLIYAHEDQKFLKSSLFMSFIKGVADDEGLELWWDEDLAHPNWDDEIKRQLQEAEIFVCILSQSFLTSDYITHVEAELARKRARREGIVIVPVLYQDCLWENHGWLRRVNHVPKDRAIHGRPHQPTLFLEVSRYIKKVLGRSAIFHDPRALHALRNVAPESLTPAQKKLLEQDSVRRANKFVADEKLRKAICREAGRRLAKSGKGWLDKKELADLDAHFLAKGSRRPDPKKVRWVLRACGLHPQNRVYG